MMHAWQLQEAKAKLSNLVRLCEDEPQIISLRGENKVIMMSLNQYSKLTQKQDHKENNVVSFFRNSPLYGLDLDIKRDRSLGRDVDL